MVSSKAELIRHIRMHIFHAQKQFYGLFMVHARFPDLKRFVIFCSFLDIFLINFF